MAEVLTLEAKLVNNMSQALRVIETDMKRLEHTSYESFKKMEKEIGGWEKKAKEGSVANPFSAIQKNLNTLPSQLAGAATGAVAGFFAFQKLSEGFHAAVRAAEEQEQADRSLKAVLEATGNTAGGTFDDLTALAGAYQNLTMFQDDAVQGAEGMLLQFDRIGKDTFPKALAASADLAAFLGTDLKSAAQSLGQALQDPESAGRRLRAMNILLTDSQEAMIKSMIAAGDLQKAQGVVLDLLSNKVGGLAEKTTKASDLLANRFGEAMEGLGTVFTGALEGVSETALKILGVFDKSAQEALDKSKHYREVIETENELAALNSMDAETQIEFEKQEKLRKIKEDALKAITPEMRQDAASRAGGLQTPDQKAAIEAAIKADAATREALKKKQEEARKQEIDEAKQEAAAQQRAEEEAIRSKAAKKEESEKKAKAQRDRDFEDEGRRLEKYYAQQEAAKQEGQKASDAESKNDPVALLQAQMEREMEATEGGEAAKLAIKRRYAVLESELQMQAAQRSGAVISQGLSAIMGLYHKHGAEYKVWAEAKNAVDTALSAQAAYESAASIPYVGWIMGPVAAAAAVAVGLQNAAKIKSAHFATGTLNAPGGRAVVGEYGPEVIDLPKGATVHNAYDSRKMMGGGNMTHNGNVTIQVQVPAGSSPEYGRKMGQSVGEGYADYLGRLKRDIRNIDYMNIAERA